MTLDELIEELTCLRDDEGVPGSTVVNMAYQPNYPLGEVVDTVTFLSKDDDCSAGTLYISGGMGGNHYAPGGAFEGGVVYPEDQED